MKEFTISKSQDGTKVIKYCQKVLPNAGSSFLYKMLRKKNITKNGKKCDANDLLQTGDVIRFFFADETFDKFSQGAAIRGAVSESEGTPRFASMGLQKDRILYEDEDVLFYNKPEGMLSQKAKEQDSSLNEYFLQYLLDEKKLTAEELRTLKPSVCNRLDRNTSGIVICGKSHKGLTVMNEMLKDRTLKKYYQCIVLGRFTEAILVKGYLKKDDKTNVVTIQSKVFDGADYIETEIEPVLPLNGYTLLRIHLITGKPHQIRAHLAYMGFPIIGDYKYGDRGVNDRLKRQFGLQHQLLHARQLMFPDEMKQLGQLAGKEILAPLPAQFEKILTALGK